VAGPEVAKLAKEVATLGWIAFAAKSEKGDYDLFIARPDGSHLKNITNTPESSEFGVRFSPDGKQMLYRRIPRGQEISHDLWGQFGTLLLANADGSNPVAQGKDGELPWASWSPDGREIACLYKSEGKIRIFDFATQRMVREMPRQGIFQQLFWSPDGKSLVGTANLKGQDWNIVSIDLATEKLTLLSRDLNCTPDWFNDSRRVIYSSRRPGLADNDGWTMLMQATADGKSRTLVYGERAKHIYFGCTSPDDRYAIFSIMPHDSMIETPMALVRLADTPIIAPGYPELKELYPGAKEGPVLHLANLPEGFEPHWTRAEIGGP
jgi:Tol biopolymer transport system component